MVQHGEPVALLLGQSCESRDWARKQPLHDSSLACVAQTSTNTRQWPIFNINFHSASSFGI